MAREIGDYFMLIAKAKPVTPGPGVHSYAYFDAIIPTRMLVRSPNGAVQGSDSQGIRFSLRVFDRPPTEFAAALEYATKGG
jgi:hypothetical protein